jgi:probable F420-dependent oxidoreductase
VTLDIGVGLWTMQSTASAPASMPALYRRFVEDAQRIEDLGYHSMWLAEHRFWYDGWCPSPFTAVAAAAAVTQRLRYGTGMLLLPQHDPLRLAETVVTVDRLSGGRVDVGVGLGHRDMEFDGLGIRRATRGARMDEALDVLRAAWSGRPWSHTGRHFRYLHQPALPPPVQRPTPPLWLGGMADAAVQRGIDRGLSFLLPQTLYADEVAAMVQRIREGWRAAGVTPGRIGILKDAWVDVDRTAAREWFLARASVHYREEAGSWWVLKGRATGFEEPELLDRQLQRIVDTPLVGDPDDLRADLQALAEAGVDLVVLRFHFDVTASRSMDAMTLFARSVLPAFEGRAS